MDWYKKYMGDYASDTAHLSLLEHGAYNMLLDHYYATEKPLPDDLDRIYRIVRANQQHEKQAVDFVLSEYFTITDDGFVHDKCEEVIAKYQSVADRNRTNGQSGGRPKQNPDDNPEETQTEPKNNLIQKPETRNQIPDTKDQTKPKANAIALTDVQEVLDFLNQKTGKAFQLKNPAGKPTANAVKIRDRLKDDYTVQQCKTVIARKCREWDTDKMRQHRTPETLFRKSNFDKYIGECVDDA